VPFEKASGELLFDVLSTRHGRGATITSNVAFSERNRVFVDDKLTAALLDRLAQHADVLVTRGPGDRGPGPVETFRAEGGKARMNVTHRAPCGGVGSGAGAVACRLPLAVSAVSGFVPV
jgi:hypothetical protein